MKGLISLVALSLAAGGAFALPKATDLVSKMGFGINIGNTMEVPISEACKDMSCWGNGLPTKAYVDSLKAAGFSSVRIPTAWYTHADVSTGTIHESWLDSVKTVVDYVVDNGMYAFVNSHWDTGWLEDNVMIPGITSVSETGKFSGDTANVNRLQKLFWTQIANKFKNYDEHVLFGSANEPGVNDGWLSSGQVAFDAARMALLKRYHETMIAAVRATGGNNATRTIVVQSPRTDESLMHALLKGNMPKDPAGEGYLMAEFHFYPYQFSLMTEDADWGNCFYYWGKDNYSTTDAEHNANYSKAEKKTVENQYAGEAYTDSVFAMLNADFAAKGIPVVIGEYAAIKRMNSISDSANLRLHLKSRAAWYKRVNELAKQYGFVTFAWDTGAEGVNDNTIIRRQSETVGSIMDYDVLNAMRIAYGLDSLPYSNIDSLVGWAGDDENRVLKITYTSEQSDSSEAGTMTVAVGGKDWSNYCAVDFYAKVNVKSNGPAAGEAYGWTSLSLFAMSGNWEWTDYNFEESDISATWKHYTVPFGDAGISFKNQKKVMAIGINLYGTQLSGNIFIDDFTLVKCDNSGRDTLANFNKAVPELSGVASGELVSSQTTSVKSFRIAKANGLNVNVVPGLVNASFDVPVAGMASVKLLNSMGQTVASETVSTHSGMNSVQLSTGFRGTGFLVVKQGNLRYTAKIRLK